MDNTRTDGINDAYDRTRALFDKTWHESPAFRRYLAKDIEQFDLAVQACRFAAIELKGDSRDLLDLLELR